MPGGALAAAAAGVGTAGAASGVGDAAARKLDASDDASAIVFDMAQRDWDFRYHANVVSRVSYLRFDKRSL